MIRQHFMATIIINIIILIAFCGKAWADNDSIYHQKITHHAESGDLVFRYSDDFWSNLAAKMSPQDQRFSHVGILIVEHDRIEVIHADGNPIESTPSLARQPIKKWLAGSERVGLFRIQLNKPTRNKIAEAANRLFKQKIAFDTQFDLSTDDKLYCTELVVKVVSSVLQDSHETPVRFNQQAFIDGREYIPVDSLYMNDRVSEITIPDDWRATLRWQKQKNNDDKRD